MVPLTLSIVMNEFDKAAYLISISNIDEKDIFGNTALFYAIMNKEPFLVEKLLNNKASIYNIDKCNDDAIYYATIVGDIDIIKHIQKRNVDYNKKYNGYTVLEIAKHNYDLEVFEVLKNHI